ncbi:hypothetical protein O7626_39230 [Micromonospora sp. WMMD1102]|uniref:hypothetical protein n=1 Tax=Micromonospora sp. WMMD1102 TaxID=3016105 RepID=UPI002414DDD4|nr:hypothetical protein [Micromonospora sp. WMMD1102]MDG4791849.1 hypothetical protein [Micromonospora sp. WMMD1102]
MAVKRARQVKAFVMHGRTLRSLLNYDGFFRWLANLPYADTEAAVAQDQVIAVTAATIEDDLIHFRFVSGNPREIPLLFDRQTGATMEARTPDNTWLAEATRVSVMRRIASYSLKTAVAVSVPRVLSATSSELALIAGTVRLT